MEGVKKARQHAEKEKKESDLANVAPLVLISYSHTALVLVAGS